MTATNKSEQAKKQAADRLANQKERGSNKFKTNSNPHHGATRSNSGQPKKK